jgi:hypothetical protein
LPPGEIRSKISSIKAKESGMKKHKVKIDRSLCIGCKARVTWL